MLTSLPCVVTRSRLLASSLLDKQDRLLGLMPGLTPGLIAVPVFFFFYLICLTRSWNLLRGIRCASIVLPWHLNAC